MVDAFIGRQAELSVLNHRLQEVAQGEGRVVVVAGEPGIGKTALVERFLQQATREGRAVVLRARCYRRETEPLKAVGSAFNELANLLETDPDRLLSQLDLRLAYALVAVFPAFRKLEAAPPERRVDPRSRLDSARARAQAVTALQLLVRQFGVRRPLILFLDDLHWADGESLELLGRLVEPPAAPPLLMLATHREEEARGPFHQLLEVLARCPASDRIELGPLPRAEAEQLARALLGNGGARVDAVVREAEGSPWLVGELVRFIERSSAREVAPDAIRFDHLLLRRMEGLPPATRALLELIAAAGEPVPQGVVIEATDATAQTWEQGISRLRVENLIRRHGPGLADEADIFHERIRCTILATVPRERQLDYHRTLARAMERFDPERVEFVARHRIAAGERGAALETLLRSAEAASRWQAAERAAQLYRQALDLVDPEEVVRRSTLWKHVGDALADAGRLGEAAAAYSEAAAGAEGEPGLKLRLAAAEQLLRGADVARGIKAMQRVLAEVGVSIPSTPGRTLLALLAQRARLRLRGRRLQRRVAEIGGRERLLLEALSVASICISTVAPLPGAVLQGRYLLEALEVGEVGHTGIALGLFAIHLAARGGRHYPRARELVLEGEALLAKRGYPRQMGLITMARGLVEYLVGHWREARGYLERAEAIFLDVGHGVEWELATTRCWTCFALIQLGELVELTRRFDAHLAEAERLENRYALAALRARLRLAWLIRDDLDQAREVLEIDGEGDRRVEHFFDLHGRCELALYLGEGKGALALLEQEVPALRRAQLHRVQIARNELASLHGRAALAAAADLSAPAEKRPYLEIARKAGRQLAAEGTAYARAWGALIEAGVQHQQGTPGAGQALDQAIELLQGADCGLLAIAARWRKGEGIGGEQGRALTAEVERELRERGVCSPERLVQLLAPGLGAGTVEG
jgi:hypothetical protein